MIVRASRRAIMVSIRGGRHEAEGEEDSFDHALRDGRKPHGLASASMSPWTPHRPRSPRRNRGERLHDERDGGPVIDVTPDPTDNLEVVLFQGDGAARPEG